MCIINSGGRGNCNKITQSLNLFVILEANDGSIWVGYMVDGVCRYEGKLIADFKGNHTTQTISSVHKLIKYTSSRHSKVLFVITSFDQFINRNGKLSFQSMRSFMATINFGFGVVAFSIFIICNRFNNL